MSILEMGVLHLLMENGHKAFHSPHTFAVIAINIFYAIFLLVPLLHGTSW